MQNLILGSVVIGGWALAATLSLAPVDVDYAPAHVTEVAVPDMNLLAEYQSCARAAEVRLLASVEAKECSEAYLRLKLSFMPEMDMDEFQSLPMKERWAIQQRGYAALLAWRESSFGS